MTKKKDDESVAAEYLLQVHQGDFIFREDDESTEMYIVQEGRVEILEGSTADDRCLARLEKGDFFGEAAVLGTSPRGIAARAASRCRLLRIDSATLDLLLHANPNIAFHLLRRLSQRAHEFMLAGTAPGSSFAQQTQPIPVLSDEEARPRARLVHEASGLEFQLTQSGESVVGRPDPDSNVGPDIDLTPTEEDPSVSRHHATIRHLQGQFFVVEEVASTNGSWVRGERVEPGVPAELKPGDEVQFGRVKLRFVQ